MDITQGVPFDSFGLSEPTMRAIRNKGYTVSTPVQAGCIPPMLAGKDVIAKAPTGTGKTMAFGLPIIERVDRESEAVQALILAPTRELAMQITQELREVAVYHEGLRVVCLYGGEPIGKQINALKRKPQIVVATPGRLSDHMKRRTVTVKEVQTVVLDEADRMLDMGFIHDVTRILDKIPNRKNLGMFSATISRPKGGYHRPHYRRGKAGAGHVLLQHQGLHGAADQVPADAWAGCPVHPRGHPPAQAGGGDGPVPGGEAPRIRCNGCGRPGHRRGRCGRGV